MVPIYEINIASRPQKRRDEGTHDPNIAARPHQRRVAGTHGPNIAARSQKRREDGTHEPNIAARSHRRREDGTQEPNVAEGAVARDPSDADLSINALCRGTGVAYIKRQIGESNSARERRRERMRLLSLRTRERPDGEIPARLRSGLQRSGSRSKHPGLEKRRRRAAPT